MKQSENKLYFYLNLIGDAYKTADFKSLYQYLKNDCVFESQWVFTPITGKENIIEYYENKADVLRKSNTNIDYHIVEILNVCKENLCLHLIQNKKSEGNDIILILELDKDEMISKIDICIPQLFSYKNII